MEICHDGHSEIVHECFMCPFCAVLKEMADKDAEIDRLGLRAEEYSDEAESLRSQVDDLKAAAALAEKETDDG